MNQKGPLEVNPNSLAEIAKENLQFKKSLKLNIGFLFLIWDLMNK